MSSKTIKEHFEANVLDGDDVNDCGRAMLAAKYVLEYITENYILKTEIREIIKECIGEMEYRNTEDMSLSTWSAEDLKAFGRNELRNEIRTNLEKRLK